MSAFAYLEVTVLFQNKGITEEQLFQIPAKLHLTPGVPHLFNEEEKMAAIEAGKEVVCQIQQETLRIDPCQIQLVGLDIMNDDESAVDILYTQVQLLPQRF